MLHRFKNISGLTVLLTLLLHSQVPLPQITNSRYYSLYSSPRTKKTVSCYYDQRSVFQHLHTSSLVLITQSMDIHPNPGPPAFIFSKKFTNPNQRKLFSKAKRLQLKLTRYEHHESNFIYYHNRNVIPKGLVIKCRATIDLTSPSNEQFYQQWTGLLKRTSRTMIKLLKAECQKHLKLLRSELHHTWNELKATCCTSTFQKIKCFLLNSTAEICNELKFKQRKKQSSSGRYASRAFVRTRQFNPVNLPNLLHTNVINPYSQVTTSANHTRDHDQSINDLLNTTVNHSSSNVITDAAANVKQTETDTGDVTTVTFN